MKVSIFSLVGLIVHFKTIFATVKECPSEGISYLPHPDCHHYIVCLNGKETKEECPRYLYYNPRTEHCDFPENVPECGGGTSLPTFPSTTTKISSMPTFSSTQWPATLINTTVPTTLNPSIIPSITTQLPLDTWTECGQVINANDGFIEYKLNENYKAGELCVFFIRLLTAFNCDFTLLSHGIKNFTSDTISVIRDIDSSSDVNLPVLKLATVGFTVRLKNGHFIVVLKTTTDHGTGFRLRFQGIISSPPIRGLTLVFNNQMENPLSFPLMPHNENRIERDTIVITSGSKLLTEPNLELQILANFSNPKCNAYYKVHSFEGSITKYEGRVCGTGSHADIIKFRTKGLFIVGFRKVHSLKERYFGTLNWYDDPERR